MNINDKIRATDSEYSENEMFLECGLPSLMLYEPIQYKNLIVEINIQRDKYIFTVDRMKFVPAYKQVYSAQRRKLRNILERIEKRTIRIFHEPTRDDMVSLLRDTWKYDDSITNTENVYCYAADCLRRLIRDTEEEIYILKYYPSVYYNQKGSYIDRK